MQLIGMFLLGAFRVGEEMSFEALFLQRVECEHLCSPEGPKGA